MDGQISACNCWEVTKERNNDNLKTTEKGFEVSESPTADKAKEAEKGTETREDLNGGQVREAPASSAPFAPNDTCWELASDPLLIFHLGVWG